MRKPLIAVLMIALLSLSLLAGCAASAAEQPHTPAQAAVKPTEPPARERITAEEAEAIALAHAGVSRENVSYLRTEFDYDNGTPEYEVEFFADGWEYDYEIQALTGDIIRSQAEPPEVRPTQAPEEPRPTEPPAQKPEDPSAPADPQRISKDAAMDIALADAGLSRDQVTGLLAQFDYDDGVPEYDVEFRSGGYEYDYDIHAETGAIRSRDKDRDD